MKINVTSPSLEDYYLKALKIIGLFAPPGKDLSEAEAVMLVQFMTQPEKYKYYPFSAAARKEVMARSTVNHSKQTLSQKITSLVAKGYLFRDEDNFIDYNKVIKELIKQTEKNEVPFVVNLSLR